MFNTLCAHFSLNISLIRLYTLKYIQSMGSLRSFEEKRIFSKHLAHSQVQEICVFTFMTNISDATFCVAKSNFRKLRLSDHIGAVLRN